MVALDVELLEDAPPEDEDEPVELLELDDVLVEESEDFVLAEDDSVLAVLSELAPALALLPDSALLSVR